MLLPLTVAELANDQASVSRLLIAPHGQEARMAGGTRTSLNSKLAHLTNLIELIRISTPVLAGFLDSHLPFRGQDWWEACVVSRLTYGQQRVVEEQRLTSLDQLDFAALLRVLDQNWYELSAEINLPREGRGWVKELQTVRNKWAHLSSQEIAVSEVYRDADTLCRLMDLIGEPGVVLGQIKAAMRSCVETMSGMEGIAAPSTMNTNTTISVNAKFGVGSLVALKSNHERIMPVIAVNASGFEPEYTVFDNSARANYFESQLICAESGPTAGGVATAKELQALLTSINVRSSSTATLLSMRSGRVDFIPYQYRPVLKLIRSDQPRLLIADEVGVGKTIEAGLIIKELRARMDISSILIICPKALVAERKWELEMKRFAEEFTPLGGDELRYCLHEMDLDGEWPSKYLKAIVPFSLFDEKLVQGGVAKNPKSKICLESLDPPPKFDLVIVDEAHNIRNPETWLHRGVRYFCDNAAAVLLLSATPVQLGNNDLFTLLNVLRPDLVLDTASFQQMAEPNAHIADAVKVCRAANDEWQQLAIDHLDAACQTNWGQLFLRGTSNFQSIRDRLHEPEIEDIDRVVLIRQIEELYTFSPLISRTRRRDIGTFTTRKAETVEAPFTEAQRALHDRLINLVALILERFHGQQNVKFMMTTLRRQAASCLYGLAPLLENMLNGKLDSLEYMEINNSDTEPDCSFVDVVREEVAEVIALAQALDLTDPKVNAFMKVLAEKLAMPKNKALVFSTFRHTLGYLAKHVESAGMRFALIDGSVDEQARRDLRSRFALPREDLNAIDVMLSSEVGCEGLDFQFCDLLVNYDLPWNPMKIEQRIGRIDRYGQKSETVAIVNLITPGTVDADIYERCLMRIGVFEQAIGGTEVILGEVAQAIGCIAESYELSVAERQERLRQLDDNILRRIREDQDLEVKQAELVGLTVPKDTMTAEIEAAENPWLSPQSLHRFVSRYLMSQLELDADPILGDKPQKKLRLSKEARTELLKYSPSSTDPHVRAWQKWLKGPEPLLDITFDQTTATADPTLSHLSIGHPLVLQAVNHTPLGLPLTVSLNVQTDVVPCGTYPFALYRWKKEGVRADESLIPICLDSRLSGSLLALLANAADGTPQNILDAERTELERLHHAKWTAAQANHIAENREQVEYKIQSLLVSHSSRCKVLEDHISNAKEDKIRLMKQSERTRAEAGYQVQLEKLLRAAESGDVHVSAVVFGTVNVALK